jgi:hypothetical protein
LFLKNKFKTRRRKKFVHMDRKEYVKWTTWLVQSAWCDVKDLGGVLDRLRPLSDRSSDKRLRPEVGMVSREADRWERLSGKAGLRIPWPTVFGLERN